MSLRVPLKPGGDPILAGIRREEFRQLTCLLEGPRWTLLHFNCFRLRAVQ